MTRHLASCSLPRDAKMLHEDVHLFLVTLHRTFCLVFNFFAAKKLASLIPILPSWETY